MGIELGILLSNCSRENVVSPLGLCFPFPLSGVRLSCLTIPPSDCVTGSLETGPTELTPSTASIFVSLLTGIKCGELPGLCSASSRRDSGEFSSGKFTGADGRKSSDCGNCNMSSDSETTSNSILISCKSSSR